MVSLSRADRFRRVGDARAIDQDALLAVRRRAFANAAATFSSEVTSTSQNMPPNLARDLLAPRNVAIEYGDFRAAPRQLARGGFAEP